MLAMNPFHPATRPHAPRQRGSSLIEVLVAILILSIGLLGIAGLQASSLRFSQGGWARAAVSASLSDFAERVRTNPDSGTTAYVLAADYATQRAAIDAGTVAAAKNCEAVSTCTAAEMAQYQLAEWRLSLARDLPGGAGFVSGSRDTGYVVTAIWLDKNRLDKTGALEKPEKCDATYTLARARHCCPAGADVENTGGIRCTNMVVVP
jgi:type IV pilus assembly protein PilV